MGNDQNRGQGSQCDRDSQCAYDICEANRCQEERFEWTVESAIGAACLLVIAGITLLIVYLVRRCRSAAANRRAQEERANQVPQTDIKEPNSAG